MGCGFHKSSRILLKKSDLIRLQGHSNEFNEKRMKILRWMESHGDVKARLAQHKKEKGNEQFTCWQEQWQREQELVNHPSMADSCNSKMPCITLIEDNFKVVCHDGIEENFWQEFGIINASN